MDIGIDLLNTTCKQYFESFENEIDLMRFRIFRIGVFDHPTPSKDIEALWSTLWILAGGGQWLAPIPAGYELNWHNNTDFVPTRIDPGASSAWLQ